MWDLIVSVPDHCLSFYFVPYFVSKFPALLLPYVFSGRQSKVDKKAMIRNRYNRFQLPRLKGNDQEPIQSNSTSFPRHHTGEEHKKKTKKKKKTAQAESQEVSCCPADAHRAILNKILSILLGWFRIVIVALPGLFYLRRTLFLVLVLYVIPI